MTFSATTTMTIVRDLTLQEQALSSTSTQGPVYPIDGNRSSEIQAINRYQSIKLVNWYRLVSANR